MNLAFVICLSSISVFFLTLSVVLAFNFLLSKSPLSKTSDKLSDDLSDTYIPSVEAPDGGLSALEYERKLWFDEFDERIRNLKSDVDSYSGSEAMELHPDVKNLPHNAVDTNRKNRVEEEVAE